MQIKNPKNLGFTLLEILLAAVIFVVSVAGIFVTLNAVRAPVTNKENQLTAAVYGKKVLDALYSNVNASTYNDTTCEVLPLNGDSSCKAFSLYIATSSPPTPAGLHEVLPANLPASLPIPPALSGCNPSLNYIVSCADNSTGNACVLNPNVARRVDLLIKWPSVETGC